MSKLQDLTQKPETISPIDEDKAKAALKDKFEKARAVDYNTYSGDRDGESLTKAYQPPKPDLKK